MSLTQTPNFKSINHFAETSINPAQVPVNKALMKVKFFDFDFTTIIGISSYKRFKFSI